MADALSAVMAGLGPAIPPVPREMRGSSPRMTKEGRGRGRESIATLRTHTSTFPSSVTPATPPDCPAPRIISLCAAPEGIIGKQFSF